MVHRPTARQGAESASSLTARGCQLRRERLWKHQPGAGKTAALILTSPESLVYFANYCPSPFVFNSVESAAALVLLPDISILIGDNLVQKFLDRSYVDDVECLEWYTGKKTAPPRHLGIAKAVREQLPSRVSGVIGTESSPVYDLGPAEWISLDSTIRDLRRSKDPDELAVIRRSVQAGEAGHAAALARIEPGMTELDAYLIVLDAATRAAGKPVVVYGDFASGPRCASERGGPPSDRVIARGDLFLLDFSVVVNGYRADFANTFLVGSEPAPKHNDLYEICMGALAAGEALLRPGVAARQVDAAIRGHFAALGVVQHYPSQSHSGHGLGLGHPEPPFLVTESTEILQPHDVVTLEPGLYVPGGAGMRFERNYHIDDSSRGHELLTRHRLGLTP
jgi:Xaa-Pro aminopeptidase